MKRDNIVISILTIGLFICVGFIGALMEKNDALELENQSLIEQVSDYQELVDVMENNVELKDKQ